MTPASSPGPFTRALRASNWKKGLVSKRLCACRIVPFSWNFVFFRIFPVYQWCVLRHEYRVESIYGLYSYYAVVNCNCFIVEVKILFVKPSHFPCLVWGSLVCV